MDSFTQIVQQVITNSLLPRKSDILQRGMIGVSAMALIAVLSFITILFLALAFYSWMGVYMTPPLAALATAGAALLIGLVIALITYVALRRKPQAPPQSDDLSQIMTAASVAAEEFGKSMESNPKTTLLLAGIAGFAAAKYLQK